MIQIMYLIVWLLLLICFNQGYVACRSVDLFLSNRTLDQRMTTIDLHVRVSTHKVFLVYNLVKLFWRKTIEHF